MFCDRGSVLPTEMKTYTPWSNKGGTDHVEVAKYLAIFQNDCAWGCSAPRKETHLEFRS